MQHLREQTEQSDTLLELLEGTSCSFCEDGHLVQERYKGNEAVICSGCGTPGAQVW
ncbi:hypothetical protein BDK88_2405 [Natrinema hispanicum]|uniref:Small CPxCG-related zinc finger protein n=1 Tax=Natrinema hispanicum TaxID=392421 RepID=A0A482YA73_9EURY|nr:hypothetical protein BDK88_2405 [Natrinema hispanicum]